MMWDQSHAILSICIGLEGWMPEARKFEESAPHEEEPA